MEQRTGSGACILVGTTLPRELMEVGKVNGGRNKEES